MKELALAKACAGTLARALIDRTLGASAHVRVAIGYAASRLVRVGLLTRPLGERLCVTCGAKFLKEYFINIMQTETQG